MANPDAGEIESAPAASSAASHKTSFIVLWLLWAAALAGAMISGNVLERHGAPLPTALRMASSLVLVATGWWAWRLLRGATAGRFAFWIALGMTLGALGDFFMAGLLSFIPIRPTQLGGIASFGLGHIAYIAGCVWLARRAGLTARAPLAIGILGWQIFALIGWYYVAYLGEDNRELLGPALVYTMLLAGTAGITSGLALQRAPLFPLALGGALFLISDLILAFGMFGQAVRHGAEAVWLTYSPGQMLIVFSILSVAAMLRARG